MQGASVRTPAWYAQPAQAYVDAVDSGQPYAGLLARQFGYTEGSIRTAVGNLRRLGYLTSTEGTRPGGSLTPQARSLLNEGND